MSLEQISELYAAIKRAEERLTAANEEQEQAKKEYDRLSKDLGDILHLLDLTSVKMADGRELGLKTTYYGSAAQDRIPSIRAFLESRNNAGILKPKKLKIDDKAVDLLPDELKGNVEYEINANTLKAFLGELGRKGEITQEVLELFAVYTENKVVIQ